uniref:Sterol desaturase n=1 Tax=Hirondellea gigas TaxID=1518452 RepID=A0A6A7GB43_9CRUS
MVFLPTPFPLPIVECLRYQPNDVESTKAAPIAADHKPTFAEKLFGRPVRIAGYLLVTYVLYFYFSPPLEAAKTIQRDWIQYIIIRNLVTMMVFYGGWHLFLYGGTLPTGPLLKKLRILKFNQHEFSYPVYHDAFFTTLGWLVSSGYEIILLHLWASGVLPTYANLSDYPIWSTAYFAFGAFWHEFHFYWGHRLLHTSFLYRWVHSLHHEARNPGPFSGLSMHPIEHLIYFSSVVTAFVVPLHPMHLLYQASYSRLAPISGHDGFDSPAGGSLDHYLHHVKTTVNFGTALVPLDKLFGTWDDGSEWRKQKAKEQ